MSFLDDLAVYLREVAQPFNRPAVAVMAPSHIDPAGVRSTLVRSLERLEKEGKLSTGGLDGLFSTWQRGDAIIRFANRLAQLLGESIGRDASNEEIKTWIEVAIARRMGLQDSLSSRFRNLELDRLSNIAQDYAFGGPGRRVDIAAYASAIRATRGTGSERALTSIGRVFLELSGRDAIRWLLFVEAAQSFGRSDPWRLSRETAKELGSQTDWVDVWGDEEGFPWAEETLWRLDALGLVSIVEDPDLQQTFLNVLPTGRDLLNEIASREGSPMSVLADSLIADLTLSAAETVAGRATTKGTADVQASAVAEATARHARMVAHEIRNMLVPVKTALGALYREVQLEPPGEVVARRREGLDRGIDSIFRFVDQLVGLAALAATPPEPFDVLPTLRDGVAAIEAESGLRVDAVLPASLPPISGHRARVVMALTNVLRNASQAVPSKSPIIRLHAESIEDARAVRILIEDNGPGVPEAMRRAIFEEGISLRGGSGLGLALVREVFEKEMKGLVACDTSPLGGARFIIRIPTTGTERP